MSGNNANNQKMEVKEMKDCKNDLKNESFARRFVGEVRDVIKHKDGRVEVREGYNVVVNDITKLIAALLKQEAGYAGVQYWAVGNGNGSWDDVNPPAPAVTDTQLTSEIGRKAIPGTAVKFLDGADAETPTVTNKLQIKLTFNYADCNGSWREFGIFGGNATATANSGVLVNHKTHGLIVKTDSMEIERTIKFTFN